MIVSHRTVCALQGLTLLLVPHGGQHRARQNAWAGMSRDSALLRDRREADLAVAHAVARQTVSGAAAAR